MHGKLRSALSSLYTNLLNKKKLSVPSECSHTLEHSFYWFWQIISFIGLWSHVVREEAVVERSGIGFVGINYGEGIVGNCGKGRQRKDIAAGGIAHHIWAGNNETVLGFRSDFPR